MGRVRTMFVVRACMCAHAEVCIHVCVYTCVFMCKSACGCVCVFVFGVFTCLFVPGCVSVRACML